MNKYEYLAELRNNLSTLPKSEQDEAVKYYREVFNDAGKSNEQSVVRNLGSPELVRMLKGQQIFLRKKGRILLYLPLYFFQFGAV